jgi:hypothetical protein
MPRCHQICALLRPYHLTAFASSLRHFLQFAVLLRVAIFASGFRDPIVLIPLTRRFS